MSQCEETQGYHLDEDEILDELKRYIPHKFFNWKDYTYHRTRNTVALLDYITYLIQRKPAAPFFTSPSGSKQRRAAMRTLKHIVPDASFIDAGIDGGKRGVCSEKNRDLVLLAAQEYLHRLIQGEEDLGPGNSRADDSEDPPEKDYAAGESSFGQAPDVRESEKSPASTSSIDRLLYEAQHVKASIEAQSENTSRMAREIRQLRQDKAELEEELEEQREDTEVARKEAERGKQDVETLKSMMAAAGIVPALVEVALGLVRDGKSVQDLVAEALQKSFHP